MNNYQMISLVGNGAYSCVYKAIDVITKQVVAIKKMNIKYRSIIERQISILKWGKSHPNIISLLGYYSTNQNISLVFQYLPLDLIHFYKNFQQDYGRCINEHEIIYIVEQICQVIYFLHSHGIMHRDIKPENILINPENLKIKLIDFGFAKLSNNLPDTNYIVTRWYRPPEIVLGLPYDQKIDIFCLGALVLELYLGKEVFRSHSNLDQLQWICRICGVPKWEAASRKIRQLNIEIIQNEPQIHQIVSNLSVEAKNLLIRMLQPNPILRISSQQILEHSYFNKKHIITRNNLVDSDSSQRYIKANSSQKNFKNKITSIKSKELIRPKSLGQIGIKLISIGGRKEKLPQKQGIRITNESKSMFARIKLKFNDGNLTNHGIGNEKFNSKKINWKFN